MKSNYYTIHKNKTPKLVVKNRRQKRMKFFASSIEKVGKTSEKVVESLEEFVRSNYAIKSTTFRFVTMRSDR